MPEKQTQITTEIPSVETDDGRVYDFIGWALPEHSSAADETIDYNSGQMAVFYICLLYKESKLLYYF